MDAFDLRQWAGFKQAGGDNSQPAIIEQITIDSRRIDSPRSLFIALKGERIDGHHYVEQAAQAGAKYALVSQHWIPPTTLKEIKLLRVEDPLRAFQELSKTYRLQLPTKIIGITGSFGKTMVKDLLQAFLCTNKKAAASPESFNSQIGVPLSLFTLRKEHEIGIIEAAISEKNEMDFLADLIRPDYSILAPLGNKHLTTLNDLPTLAQETIKLILATSPSGWSLLPSYPLLKSYQSQTPCPYYFWDTQQSNLPHASHLTNSFALPAPYQLIFPNQEIYKGQMCAGYSYFLNLINMSVKAAWLAGIQAQDIKEVLSDYHPEPMRTEIWKAPIGATFINDTYSSDPQSIDLSLRQFNYTAPEQKKIFVFGGIKGQRQYLEKDYRLIGQSLSKSAVSHLILFGKQEFKPLIDEIKKLPSCPEITVCEDRNEALNYLKINLHSNDLILIKGERKIPLETLTEVFNDSLNNNQCTINFAAVRSNLLAIKKKLPPSTRIMTIIKALAYGTDDIRMAKFLASCGIDILGVSYVDEAVSLKREGIKQAIFSINAAPYEAVKVVKWDLEVGVSDLELIQALEKEASLQNKIVKVHLHINTGMGRFGCRPEEALKLAQTIKISSHLELEGILTHFACAEDPHEDTFTYSQIDCFDRTIAELKSHGIEAKWIHAANSSGAIRFHLPQYNMVRTGLATYGLYSSEATRESLDLRLALSLTSRIVGINICKKGETVSYGRSYVVERDTQKIAVLPIGYFDGLHRNYSGKAYVIIRGRKAPMVGKICMDYMMVDVTDIPEVAVGDKVLIFGEDEFGQYVSPEDLAMSGNSIIHELITCLGPRIQRIFIYEEGHQIR